MTVMSGIAFAQARIQSRYGQRADAAVWMRLNNIHDLGSYLQRAQQSPLRHWVLGISSTHSSHEIELTLRQKYRQQVDEVAAWMPVDWKPAVLWIKRLIDLPVIHYLANGGEPLSWMRLDPTIKDFVTDNPALRLQAIHQAGNGIMVDRWQRSGSILMGWLAQWQRILPGSAASDRGLQALEQLLFEQIQLQSKLQQVAQSTEYDVLLDRLRLIFRRNAFRPAAVCAYLAIVALDLHRIRSDLLQRLYFRQVQDIVQDLPQ